MAGLVEGGRLRFWKKLCCFISFFKLKWNPYIHNVIHGKDREELVQIPLVLTGLESGLYRTESEPQLLAQGFKHQLCLSVCGQ